MTKEVVSRQHLRTELLVIGVDGSAVTTSKSSTGLVYGKHIAKVEKGSGADSNLVTITLNKALGLAPRVKFQERTLDCMCRLEEDPTKTVIKVRTLELDGTTKEDDADFDVWIFGTREVREGDYG